MSDAYDPALQDLLLEVSKSLKLDYKVRQDGTYCFVSGPCYETRIECRFLQSIGGDAVGMSTVPEVIAAKHCGMKILGLSIVTNKVVTSKEETNHASHEEVLQVVEASGKHVELLVRSLLSYSSMQQYLEGLPGVTYEKSSANATFTGAVSNDSQNYSGDWLNYMVAGIGIGAIAGGLYFIIKSRK